MILLFVALNTYFDRVYSTDWNIPLRVAAFPINADGSDVTARYIRQLSSDAFERIETFFEQEAKENGLEMERPIRLTLAPPLPRNRPARSGRRQTSVLSVEPEDAILGLARRCAAGTRAGHQVVRAVSRSRDLAPAALGWTCRRAVRHRARLRGRRMKGSNDTVIAHELLHTLGATDKYDAQTNQPMQPDGFAEPDLEPLYPQSFAELMGGRIPVSSTESTTPDSLQK